MAARTLPSPSPSRVTSPVRRTNFIDSNQFQTEDVCGENSSTTLNSGEDYEKCFQSTEEEIEFDPYAHQSESPDEEEIEIQGTEANNPNRSYSNQTMFPPPSNKRQPKQFKMYEAERIRLAEIGLNDFGVKKVKKPKGKPKVRDFSFKKEGWVEMIPNLSMKMGKPPVWCKVSRLIVSCWTIIAQFRYLL